MQADLTPDPDTGTGIMFLDCPAYLDAHGTARCGLAAEVADRYPLASTDGPLEGVRIRCPAGHVFNGPVEALTFDQRPEPAVSGRTAVVAPLAR